jgi:hypothetical protein
MNDKSLKWWMAICGSTKGGVKYDLLKCFIYMHENRIMFSKWGSRNKKTGIRG